MGLRRTFVYSFTFGIALFFFGCNLVGPAAISNGRISYNQTIQQTSKQQVFINILRSYYEEPTLFMDVTEVDAGILAQASVTGGKSGIGAHAGTSGGTLAGEVEAVAGTVQYEETPIIRYQPLQGQALVAQISTPITIDTISKLFDSDWPIDSVLNFAVDRLTPNWVGYGAALNAINALDDYGVLVIVPGSASQAKGSNDGLHLKAGNTASIDMNNVTIQVGSAGQSNALDIYLSEKGPSLYPYAYSEPKKDSTIVEVPERKGSNILNRERKEIDSLWKRLQQLYREPLQAEENRVRIRTTATTATQTKKGVQTTVLLPPVMRTRSAFGILSNATGLVDVVSRSRYQAIRDFNKACHFTESECPSIDWYMLWPSLDEESKFARPQTQTACEPPTGTAMETEEPQSYSKLRHSIDEEDKIALVIRDLILIKRDAHSLRCLYTTNISLEPTDYWQLLQEERLRSLRKYVLIIEESTCPSSSYVSYYDDKRRMCYYIDDADKISKENFLLITQFLIMQAIPPQTPPLTPTLPVGSK